MVNTGPHIFLKYRKTAKAEAATRKYYQGCKNRYGKPKKPSKDFELGPTKEDTKKPLAQQRQK